MDDKNTDWIWNRGQPGDQLTLEQREREFQQLRHALSLLHLRELRLVRARLGDLLLAGCSGNEELISLRGRMVDEEIGRRPRFTIPLSGFFFRGSDRNRKRIIETLTSCRNPSPILKKYS